ncbi:MAG: DUF309 domain-containing protein [Thermoactinomycetaceae bacterium]|jgi:predicted metal-dependent hydrolase|nr:DUF309 domain-containing protein [Bacillota bacterium]MBO2532410.1 DUF309 domain-containing protein [Thermoactinomycetaceae bacterium]
MESPRNEYPDQYVRFLVYFNIDRDYYECHEVMEELWLEEGRDPFYQGLLQVAVGLFHFRRENISGARKLFASALSKLRPYPERYMGIDLGRLRKDVEAYLKRLESYERTPFPYYDLNISIIDRDLRNRIHKGGA